MPTDLLFLPYFALSVVVVAIAVEAVTEILVASSLLDVIGLRNLAHKLAFPSVGDARWYCRALNLLLTCGWCSSVWVSAVAAWSLPGDYFGLLPWDNIAIKIFLVQRLSNLWHDAYNLVARGRVHTIDLTMKRTDAVEGD